MVLRPLFHPTVITMGFFGDLFGKHRSNGQGGAVRPSPSYQRLHRWIESRIGPADMSDPGAKARMDELLRKERSKYPSLLGSVTITRSGNDTIISGNTRPIKGRLRSLGLEWDRRSKSWIARNRTIAEADIDVPNEIAGLTRYIETVPYRSKF